MRSLQIWRLWSWVRLRTVPSVFAVDIDMLATHRSMYKYLSILGSQVNMTVEQCQKAFL